MLLLQHHGALRVLLPRTAAKPLLVETATAGLQPSVADVSAKESYSCYLKLLQTATVVSVFEQPEQADTSKLMYNIDSIH